MPFSHFKWDHKTNDSILIEYQKNVFNRINNSWKSWPDKGIVVGLIDCSNVAINFSDDSFCVMSLILQHYLYFFSSYPNLLSGYKLFIKDIFLLINYGKPEECVKTKKIICVCIKMLVFVFLAIRMRFHLLIFMKIV